MSILSKYTGMLLTFNENTMDMKIFRSLFFVAFFRVHRAFYNHKASLFSAGFLIKIEK